MSSLFVSFESLPTEILLRVLALLSPTDLIACRAVCVRWCAVVRALETEDARAAYDCDQRTEAHRGRIGISLRVRFDPALRATYATAADDTRASLDRRFRMAESESYERSAAELVQATVSWIVRCRLSDNAPFLVPCACGRPQAAWLVPTEHRREVALAQWRYLASDLARAQQLADICARLDARLFLANIDYNENQPVWFPYFLHLQSRPVGAQLARANSVSNVVAALKTDYDLANAFLASWAYGGDEGELAVEDFADWWPKRRVRLDERVAEWAAARAKGTAVAVFVNECMNYCYGPTSPWMGMTSAQLTQGLETQQESFDAMVEAVVRLVRFPIVINTGTEEHYCIVGLSPSANLVGVRVTLDYL